jgi:peptidoglycan/LPS O-acetylase OafA/YrhL
MTKLQATAGRCNAIPAPHLEYNHSREPSRHLAALDGVRGLAILLVLVYHFTLGMTGSGLVARLFLKASSAGWCGVDLFFVLSGFLITGILLDAKASPRRFRNFYARRALRIFPLYYGVLAAIFAALPLIEARVGGFDGVEGAFGWLWLYGTNLLVALRGAWFPLSHFWSLAVEEHFYLFWPFVVFGCGRKSALRVCGAMIVLALAARVWLVAHGAVLAADCLTVSRMDALAVGSFLAIAARGPGGPGAMVPLARKVALTGLPALLGLIGWRWGLSFHDAAVQTVGYLLLDLSFAALLLLVVAAPETGPLASPFRLPLLRWMGRYSYGLYVYNSLLILASDGLSLFPKLVALTGSTGAARILFVALAASTTFAAAWVSWHSWEKHFLKLKRFFPSTPPGMVAHATPCHSRT